MPSQEEMQLIEEAMKGYGVAQPEEKHNVHTFLNKVATSTDTTKTGFLSEEEIGFTPYSLRTYKLLALDSFDLANDDIWGNYFIKKGEVLTATSLSKEAKLISLAVLQRKELADMTQPKRKPNSGWFSKKEKKEDTGESN